MKRSGFQTMMRLLAGVLVCGLVMIALGGCNRQISRLTIVSVKNVDISRTHERTAQNKSERDSRTWILFLPLRRQPTVERVLEKLLNKNATDYATNAKITSGGWSLILLSRGYVRVQGDLWSAK